MIFELFDREIDLVSKMQRFVYRSIEMFGPNCGIKRYKQQKNELICINK